MASSYKESPYDKLSRLVSVHRARGIRRMFIDDDLKIFCTTITFEYILNYQPIVGNDYEVVDLRKYLVAEGYREVSPRKFIQLAEESV